MQSKISAHDIWSSLICVSTFIPFCQYSLYPYCAFNIFQKIVYCLALYTEEVNLQTFVMILSKPISGNYLCTKKFYCSHWFKKKKIKYFHFTIVKMNANYAEICRVGNVEADFQQVLLVQFSLNFHNVVVKH